MLLPEQKRRARYHQGEYRKVETKTAFLVENKSEEPDRKTVQTKKGGKGFVVGAQGREDAIKKVEINREQCHRDPAPHGQLANLGITVLLPARNFKNRANEKRQDDQNVPV